jgi:hypothetical protein
MTDDQNFKQESLKTFKEILNVLKSIDEKLKELERIRASINLRFGRK